MSEDTQKVVNTDGWKRMGALFGGILLTVGSSHLDLESRIDNGKDEQRVHWKVERAHKDSADKAFQDTVLALLKEHRNKTNK